jgi:hypothetical protein
VAAAKAPLGWVAEGIYGLKTGKGHLPFKVHASVLTEQRAGDSVGRMNASPDNDCWPWFGVYLYRADGTYSRAVWAKTRQEFAEVLPKIAGHVRKGREVAITNTGDEMLFHSRGGVIEWDGIELGPLLERYGVRG